MLRVAIAAILSCAAALPRHSVAQNQSGTAADTVRVTVSQNNDGSITTYELDPANRKAVATTKTSAGKAMSRIEYVLDGYGRYESGSVFGADGRLEFKTRYKYDATGRLEEELRLNKDGAAAMKLVYAYDSNGRAAGYAVYDPAGKLLGRTRSAAAPARAAAPPAAPAPRKGR